MKVFLMPLEGGKPFEVKKELTVAGRQEGCDLLIDHKTVSKLHCVLVCVDGMLLVRDLSSTNGCRINGQRITNGAVLPGEILAIAGVSYRLKMGDEITQERSKTENGTEMITGPELKALKRSMKDARSHQPSSHFHG
jgi:pSer/pThr/pTyr-binding forkhead associated (FHA) protein